MAPSLLSMGSNVENVITRDEGRKACDGLAAEVGFLQLCELASAQSPLKEAMEERAFDSRPARAKFN